MAKVEYDEFLLHVGRDGQIKAHLFTREDKTACQDQIVLGEQELRRLRISVSLLRQGKLDGEPEALRLLGEDLYLLLFPNDVGQLFEQALHDVRAQPGRRLRVSINVDPLSEVASWPLEFMRRPGPDAFFLATKKELLTLSRCVRLPDRKRLGVQPDSPPLRVLVVVSKPLGVGDAVPIDDLPVSAIYSLLVDAFTAKDLRRFCSHRSPFRPVLGRFSSSDSLEDMVEVIIEYCERKVLRHELLAEVREVNPRQYEKHFAQLQHGREALDALALLQRTPQASPLEIKLLGDMQQLDRGAGFEHLGRPATFHNLQAIVREWSPHVLHFVGHARLEDDRGTLAMLNGAGKAEWYASEDLTERFVEWGVRLVVLQPCEGAMSGTGPGFTHIASHIVQSDVPAVVAMQFAIRNDYALEFSKGLYWALAKGLTVDAAVQEGRYKISALPIRWSERHFGTPVLFMLIPDGIVHSVSDTADRLRQAQFGMSPKTLPGGVQEKFERMIDQSKELAKMGEFDLAKAVSERAFQLLAGQQSKQVGGS